MLIDGKTIAAEVRADVADGVRLFEQAHGRVPGLRVVLLGDSPASQSYVLAKKKAAAEVGIDAETLLHPAAMTQDDLLALLDDLNADDAVDGILVQLPLPDHIDEKEVIRAIDPGKDVDGFHPENVGKLVLGEETLEPCTPAGIVEMLRRSNIETSGAHAVIVGRSNIVGKPMASLLLRRGLDCTVTVCHSRTRNLAEITRQADILVAAIGRAEFVTADMVREGAAVIDVGINRVEDLTRERGYRLVGDVDFEAVREKAGAITPVPGGVGPMTIAMLLHNTLRAAERPGRLMQIADALLDSTVALVDSLARADSLAEADTSVFSDERGIGAAARGLEEAAGEAARGNLEAAAEVAAETLITFTVDNLVPAVLVGIAFWLAYRVLRSVLQRTLGRSKRVDVGVEQLILRVVRIAVFAFATVTVLSELGIEVAPLIAGLGIAGLAIGFASQDTVRNLIAGVTILLDRPFRVGDNIELQETFGTVEEITLRSTRVRTLDNQIAILPNAKVIEEKILNHSMHRALRVVVPFGIAYKESPQAAREVVLALTEGDPRLHPDFPPRVVVTTLNDSSVDLELRVHLKDSKLEVPVRFEYQEKVFEALKGAGIEIPFPHLQLFVDEAKAFEGTRLMDPPGSGPRAEA